VEIADQLGAPVACTNDPDTDCIHTVPSQQWLSRSLGKVHSPVGRPMIA
jgi:hypothetical protein